MACMYSNEESPRGHFGDSSQLKNWILDSGTTGHMIPEISDLYQDHWWKQMNIFKFQMGIL